MTLHLPLLCDWLTGYWAEQRASKIIRKEGKWGFFFLLLFFFWWDVLSETGRECPRTTVQTPKAARMILRELTAGKQSVRALL